ncbi:uncharacterized protein LOC113495646 isoform X3 [Trichoplusia ni]|uniref:Uncharacterized protein LOC113495646 isoform X3 n=1 Tax=Trichoplusia ni TaxID=7111 RepID=A0A7E5VPN3_TRINI|nr:uncharacterized protein LOC113495646 isoform X3 [Trichoplusia ni]
MGINKIMVFAGISTLLQAAGQLIFTSIGVAQYFCVIDFLRGLPILLYIKVLYFHNPNSCGSRVNIGQDIDGVSDTAFVLLTREPFTVFRTFIVNTTSLGLSALWIINSVIIIMGGAKDKQSKCIRWPWIMTTVAACGVDLVATVTYANDSFHTRSISDMMDYIDGTVSGVSNTPLDTSWTAWVMVIIYSRFVLLFMLNVFLVVIVIVDCNVKREPKTEIDNLEAPTTVARVEAVPQVPVPVQVTSTSVQATPPQDPPPPPEVNTEDQSDRDEEIGSLPSESRITTRIPRAGLSRSFRRMKTFLFRKTPSPDVHNKSIGESIQASPERSPRTQRIDVDSDKKRTVNFPETLLSLPQRLENIIAEQQRRLDRAVIDTSGRTSPPRISQSMPQLATTSTHTDAKGRRGTTVELQGQLPWAYIPAPAHRMRDQLPPDEDLPPVPLPDYTAFQSVRKASVHRAASSLSSLTQKKDYVTSRSVPCEYYTYKKA